MSIATEAGKPARLLNGLLSEAERAGMSVPNAWRAQQCGSESKPAVQNRRRTLAKKTDKREGSAHIRRDLPYDV